MAFDFTLLNEIAEFEFRFNYLKQSNLGSHQYDCRNFDKWLTSFISNETAIEMAYKLFNLT